MEFMVRKFSGRFQNLDEATLQMMRLELKTLLKSWGAVGPGELGAPVDGGNIPLWMEVEFLDNIVQFELDMNPYLYGELVN